MPEDNELLDEAMDAVMQLFGAQAEYNAARAKYADCYSWDYSGYEIDRLDKAKDAAREAINAYIDSRVASAIAKA